MKITFFSNFLNHHQLPFCKEMYKCIGEDFKFVATEPVPEERLNMGYHDMSTQYPFALNCLLTLEKKLSEYKKSTFLHLFHAINTLVMSFFLSPVGKAHFI